MLEYILNQKGKLSLIYQGHIFTRERIWKQETYWKCRNYCVRPRQCTAQIHTQDETVTKEVGQHNHPPDIHELEALRTLSAIRDKAKITHDMPDRIISESIGQLHFPTKVQMPALQVMKRTVCSIRQCEQSAPANPSNLLELEIPNEFRSTILNKKFLQVNTGPELNRIIIYSTDENLQWMDCEIWAGDGTFDTVPSLFFSTIHYSSTKR